MDENGFTVASSDLRQGADSLNEKSIYAVHAAMGLSVSDILLQGCQNIIVEGPSDQHYLNSIKSFLIKEKLLAPKQEMVFVPSGGVKGVPGVVSILSGKTEDLPYVLVDSDTSGQDTVKKLSSGLYKDQKDREQCRCHIVLAKHHINRGFDYITVIYFVYKFHYFHFCHCVSPLLTIQPTSYLLQLPKMFCLQK